MSTMTIGHIGQANRTARMPKALRLAILLGTLIFMAVTVNALIIVADSRFSRRDTAAQDRSVVTHDVLKPETPPRGQREGS